MDFNSFKVAAVAAAEAADIADYELYFQSADSHCCFSGMPFLAEALCQATAE